MRIRRSIIEVPTMNDRKWNKVPDIPADVIMVDMEDTVPPPLKPKARERIVEMLRDPSHLGGREALVRPNNISTEWGREDVAAIAEAGVALVNYPMTRSRDEVEEVVELFRSYGASPEIWLAVETPEFVIHMEDIASVEGVGGILFGLGDLSLESRISMFDGARPNTQGFLYARTKAVMVARAYGLYLAESILIRDLNDLEAVRDEVEVSKQFGFEANVVIYPAHVPVVNEARTPKPEEIDWARRVVDAYEEGLAAGQAAVKLGERWMTIHQYKQAQRTLELAAAFDQVAA